MENLAENLRKQAEAIVRRGESVRKEIAQLAIEGTQACAHEAESMLQTARAILDGAVQGARQSMPEQAGGALRQVIDGLGDAFQASAQAVQLTLDEARGAGKQFAREDLDKILQDFKTVGDMFVETVSRATQQTHAHLTSQSDAIRAHAEQALRRAQSRLESVAQVARQDLRQLTEDAMKAGAAAARQAAGVFFTELGRHLQRWGDHLTHPKDRSAS